MAMQDIRKEALALFARNGYEGTSLADIAKAVGIKTPSIYAHFASKDELYLAVLDWVLAEQDRLLASSMDDSGAGGTENRLRRIYLDFTSGYVQRTESAFYKRALFFSPPGLQPVVRERVLRLERRIIDEMGKVLDEGRCHGELAALDNETILSAFFCLVDGMFLEYDLYEAELFDRRLRQAWTVFWRGVSGNEAHGGGGEDV